MKKRSKILITSLVLCAVVAIGATMAYFFTKTSQVTNTFTLSSGIQIKLAEPKWDNKDYDGNPAGITTQLGNALCLNFVPGREIPKDPKVKNASQNNAVWIAIKLDYTVGSNTSDYAALSQFADINFDTNTTGKWEANADHTIFYYKDAVPAGSDTTTPLFDKVTILKNVAAGVSYQPFDIKVTAYAVQAEGLDYSTAKTELTGYIN